MSLKVKDNIKAFVSEITDETNTRALIILCHTAVDQHLTDLFKIRLRPCKTTDSLLEGWTSPLSTFSARMNMALAIGIIGEQFYDDLNILNDLRNDCAHSVFLLDNHKASPISFNTRTIADRINNLSFVKAVGDLDTMQDARTRFIEAIKYMLTLIAFELDFSHDLLGETAFLYDTRLPVIREGYLMLSDQKRNPSLTPRQEGP